MPKFLVFVPGNADSEAGVMPSTEAFEEMGKYNEQLAKAGVLLAAEGLMPTSGAAKVRFDDAGRRTVIDGPFTEAKEIIAGYWMLQASSLPEVLEWVKRAPFGGGVTVEVRPIASMDDLGPSFTPELREAEQQLQGATRRVAARLAAWRRRLRSSGRSGGSRRPGWWPPWPATPATWAWPRSWPRTRWSRPWRMAGRGTCRPSPAPG